MPYILDLPVVYARIIYCCVVANSRGFNMIDRMVALISLIEQSNSL